MKDRRKFRRYEKNIPVKIEWEGQIFDGSMVDLSMTGAGCYVKKRLPLYAEIRIHFLQDDKFLQDEVFSCTGTVVRSCKSPLEADYQLGIFFTHLSEEILSRIMDLAYY